jgi:IS30 family transposase
MQTYSRLTCEQRCTIEAMNRNGSPQSEIADAIGKHASTASRELRWLGVCWDYCFAEAQRDAESKTNGKEFALHKLLAEIHESDAYFARPYPS